MKHAEVDDRLEVIVPEDTAPIQPPSQREPFRITARQVGLAAGLLVAGILFAAYAAFAVSGVRALERDRDRASQLTAEREALSRRLLASVVADDDTAIVAEATRDLLLEHKDRVLELANHTRRVRAVDPGVRGLRSALVGAFMRDAHDLEHAAEAPAPSAAPMLGRGYPYADRLLEQERRQWRLGAGKVPEPTGHLRAADIALVRLATWADVKTGARLLVAGDSGLRLLDLDSSVQTPIDLPGGFGDVAAGPGVIAVTAEGGVVLIDPDDLFSRRLADLGEDFEPRQVVLSAGGGAWVQPSRDRAVVEVDREGRRTGAQSASYGDLVADVGPSLLWSEPRGEDVDRRVPSLANYVLTDKASGAVVARWELRELLAASPAGMAWRVGSQYLEVMDGTGRIRPVPTRGDLFPRSAAFAVDGRLAVGWGDGRLDVIDVGANSLLASVPTGGPAVLRWTPLSQYVFFAMGTGLGWYRPGDEAVHDLRLRNTGGFLTAAF
jgi:hypothetical protein